MGFRIPGNDRFSQRAARAQEAQREQDRERHEKVMRQVKHLELMDETDRWRKRMAFDIQLLAGQILDRLIEQRDRNAPKTADEPWNEEFREAVELIPEARRFLEECMMDCTEVRKE